MKLKILWVTTQLPEPPDSGGRIVTFNTLRHLSLRGFEITLCALTGKRVEGLSELEQLLDLRILPPGLTNRQGYLHLLKNTFSSCPYVISKYWRTEIWRFIARLLSERSYDLVHCDHLHTAQYGLLAKEEFGLPVVLTAHNVETVLWEGASHMEHNLAKKIYYHLQRWKMRAYEAQAVSRLDGCIVLSSQDAKRMERLNPRIKPIVIPPGVDTGYFQPVYMQEETGAVVFVGAMEWPPNANGILWFHKWVWPKVKKASPGTKLYIVGGRPSRAVQRLGNDPDVVVTGFVTDVRDYLSRAQVFIAPLLMGSGVRIKILNALAMGRAVVSTPLGCEGISLTNGENIWIAETAGDFAQKVTHLLEDEVKRRHLGQAGLQLVQNHYRWDRVAESIEKLYQQVTFVRGRGSIPG